MLTVAVAGYKPSAVTNTNPKVNKATIANLSIFFFEPENLPDRDYLIIARSHLLRQSI
ncbi:hypothetical protein QT971_09125 [Microcoleus sp. herbarium19]|uniref:hypothetical protein n=1 Tax=Microcoleus sp. herbarium19 TaxID=3055440 RepID=UPI002FD4A2D0